MSKLEGELELHREICVVRLMFRCDICYDDYVSKEGILNHLDLHEITGESKELHFQEIKAKDTLYQCALCNDQRAYSECHYWKHVHDIHDVTGHLKSRDQTVSSDCGELEADRKLSVPFKTRNQQDDDQDQQNRAQFNDIKSHEGQSSVNPSTIVDPQSCDYSFANLDDSDARIDKVDTLSDNSKIQVQSDNRSQTFSEHLTNCQYLCDICGCTLTSYSQAKHHKLTQHTDGKHQCPHCLRIFHVKRKSLLHELACAGRKHSCEVCGRKFKNKIGAKRHKLRAHHATGASKGDHTEGMDCAERQFPNNVDKMDSEDSSADCSVDNSVSTLVKCSILHDSVIEQKQSLANNIDPEALSADCIGDSSPSTAVKIFVEHYSSMAIPANLHRNENSSNELSDTKCSYCKKEFSIGLFLRRHIEQCHVPCICNICGVTFESFVKVQYHKIKLHKEPNYKCPHCPKTFEKSIRYSLHLSICKGREFSCDLCDHKFKTLKYVKKHKRLYHQDKNVVKKASEKTSKEASERALKKAPEKVVEETKKCRTDDNEERTRTQNKRTAVEKSQNSKLMLKADELIDHKRTCPKQSISPNVPLDGNIEIKMEIQVEDTMLLEKKCRDPNDDRGKSSSPTLTSVGQPVVCKDPGDKSKDVSSETVHFEKAIKIKQEYPEEKEETFIVSQSTTECSLCRGDKSDRNESPLSHEAGDQFSPCSTCGHVFGIRPSTKYHMVGIESKSRNTM